MYSSLVPIPDRRGIGEDTKDQSPVWCQVTQLQSQKPVLLPVLLDASAFSRGRQNFKAF
jgi:hypothetical protein